jgi:hypothetical protein
MLEIRAFGILDLHFGLIAVPFDFAFPDGCGRMFWKAAGDFIQCAFLAARAGIEHQDFHGLVRPFPIADFRHVVAVIANVLFVLDELVAQELFEMRADALQARNAIDCIARQMEAIEVV